MARTTENEVETKRIMPRRTKKTIISTVIHNSNEQKIKLLKEKNRESAQRSRDNRKKYIVSLENKISQLRLENDYLRKQLSHCQCSKSEDSPILESTNDSQQEKEMQVESPMESVYERVSVRSFTSCSNFLILSLIVMFCIFGYVDVAHDGIPAKTQYFSQESLKTAIAWFNEESCDADEVRQPARPSKYSRLEMHSSINLTQPVKISVNSTVSNLTTEPPVRKMPEKVNPDLLNRAHPHL